MKARIPPSLTAQQRKTINEICNREVRERVDRTSTFADALMLLSLSHRTEMEKDELIEFYRGMREDYFEYLSRYELSDEDGGWLLLERCKTELGIDIEALEKECVAEQKAFKGRR